MPDLIERVDLWLVSSRIRNARSHGSGDVSRSVRRVVLALRTRDGLTGWGEAAPWAPFGNLAESTLAILAAAVRPVLVGRDPAGITACTEAVAHAVAGHPEAKAAAEVALWDLAGQRAGLPVHALLGGKVRDRLPLSFSLADPDWDADLDRARAMAGAGHRIFKVKTGYAGHREDLRRMEALRAALPEADLRIDYNQGLQPFGALRVLRDMEGFAPTFIEQPVPRGQEAALAALSAALDTPVLADESVYGPADMLAAARGGWADAVSIKLMKCGGIGPARAVDAIAGAAGMPTYGGTLWEGGIALAAAAHLMGALPNATLGCEFYMPSYALVDDVCGDALRASVGHVQVPDGPGLGVRVDEAELRARVVGAA